jgi:hypothetical protein
MRIPHQLRKKRDKALRWMAKCLYGLPWINIPIARIICTDFIQHPIITRMENSITCPPMKRKKRIKSVQSLK